MTSIRHSLVSFACVVVLFAAPAQASAVLVSRLEASGVDGARADALDASLRAQARQVVRERLLPASPSRPAGCGADELCAAALAGQHGATFVVVPTYSVAGEEHKVRVQLFEASGRLVGAAARDLPAAPDEDVWRGVVVQLLSPETYVGELRIEGAPPDASVSVDRVPLSRAERAAPVVVSVGKHTVDVTASGHEPLRREVDVAYGAVVDVDAALPSPAVGAPGPLASGPAPAVPWWPAAVTGGIAGTATLIGVVATGDLISTSRDVTAESGALRNSCDCDPHAYAVRMMPDKLEGSRLVALRAAQRNNLVIISAAGSIALVAGATSAALLARWALAGDEEEAP